MPKCPREDESPLELSRQGKEGPSEQLMFEDFWRFAGLDIERWVLALVLYRCMGANILAALIGMPQPHMDIVQQMIKAA